MSRQLSSVRSRHVEWNGMIERCFVTNALKRDHCDVVLANMKWEMKWTEWSVTLKFHSHWRQPVVRIVGRTTKFVWAYTGNNYFQFSTRTRTHVNTHTHTHTQRSSNLIFLTVKLVISLILLFPIFVCTWYLF